MDTVETASRRVKQMGRQIESSMGNLKNMMSSISLVGDAKHFQEGQGKFDALREKLENKSDSKKLDAMKTLIAMMTLGRDVSELFPAVVKNVVVENMEIKKFVYMYVIHYAQTNSNLALLSISSFQKDMASPNPLVRAKALHAMSCMRVSSVAHLIILQLKNAVKDSSPYVRRTAAQVLPSVNNLDTKFKVDLIAMLTTLLSDDDVYVLSGALYAFNLLSPTKFDLIHPNYRKICHLLADMDEYGQIVALSVLQRYCRNQFKSPFAKKTKTAEDEETDENKENKDKEGSDSDDEEDLLDLNGDDEEYVELDPDHKLLIASCKNLIFSMNSQVVLSVVTLLYYCAPKSDCLDAIRALIQFVNFSKREITYCILANISTMASERSDLFAGFYKDFYIKSIEAGFIKELKLDILSKIATDSNISHILHEFEAYAKDPDIKFRCSTIEAMGRCCSMIPDVAEKTMSLLMSLLSPSNQSPDVVASSVIVIRQIIQRNPSNYERSMLKLLKLLQKTNVPAARCAIVWIIGEYRQYISDYVPDALRILAKKFIHEADEVKMQILNLAVKVYLADPKKVILLFKYILDLCKYDQNYDLRDRARLVRCIFFQKKKKKSADSSGPIDPDVQRKLRTKMQEMFLSEKKLPEIASPFKDRDRFVMNTLSHMVLHSAGDGYVPLEEFPEIPPDNADKRTPEDTQESALWKSSLNENTKGSKKDNTSFFDDSDSLEEYTSDESDTDSDTETDTDESTTDSDTDSDTDSMSDTDESTSGSEDSDEIEESEESDEESDESSTVIAKTSAKKPSVAAKKSTTKKKPREQSSDSEEDEESDEEDTESEESSSELEIAEVMVTSKKSKDEKKESESDDNKSKKKKKSKVKKVQNVASSDDSDGTDADDESDEEEEVVTTKKSKKKKGGKKEEKAKPKAQPQQPAATEVDLLGGLFGDMDAKTKATETKSTSKSGTATTSAATGGGFDMLDLLGGGTPAKPPTDEVVEEVDEKGSSEDEAPKKKKKGKKSKKKKEESSSSEEEEVQVKKSKKKGKGKKGKKQKVESSEESGWSDDSEEEEEEKPKKKKKEKSVESVEEKKSDSMNVEKQKKKERADQLSDLFSTVMGDNVTVMGGHHDIMGGAGSDDILFGASADSLIQKKENVGFKGELLNHTHTQGLQIDYEFVREPSRYGVRFNQIRLIFENKWDNKMRGISLSPHNLDKSQQDYRDIFGGGIEELKAGEKKPEYIHVQFGKTSEMRFDINVEEGTNKKRYTAKIKGIPGELMRPNISYSVDDFMKKKKASGAMSERNLSCDIDQLDEAANNILKAFNVGIINSGATKTKFDMNKQRYFAGYLLSDDSDVLIALEVQGNGKIVCTIHCTEFMLVDAITQVARKCLTKK